MNPKRALWLIIAIVLGGVIALFFTSLAVDAKVEATKREISKLGEISSSASGSLNRGGRTDIDVAFGQEIYVPVYSELQGPEGRRKLNFSINLSIRNTDPEQTISIDYIDFYDTEGQVVKKFGDGPIPLGPMATRQVHIRQSDPAGGVGANFYLQWSASSAVNEPIVEAVMISSEGTQGFSWLSQGRVVKQLNASAE